MEQIDTMTEQVNNFQNQAKKLPKALRDWQAFVDCKKVIDDFLEELPLFQQLASKAMRPRYEQQYPFHNPKDVVMRMCLQSDG